MNPAADIKAALRAKIGPERLAGVIAELPPAAREKLKRTFEPRSVKTITRIRRRP